MTPQPDSPHPAPTPEDAAAPLAFTRPHEHLMVYYIWSSLLWGPLFPVVLFLRYKRYKTLRYRIEEDRLSAAWGVLNHQEVSLNYERVQDIHLRRNWLERRLSLARIELQTASGDSNAEIRLEGCLEYEALRKLLYARVQKAQNGGKEAAPAAAPHDASETAALLREIAGELRALRLQLAERPTPEVPDTARTGAPAAASSGGAP